MNVLQVHNWYQRAGGEDAVFKAEAALLRGQGHHVTTYEEHNNRIDVMSRGRAAARTIWSSESRCRISETIQRVRPDVCHFHNTFPLISPSAYYACRAAGVPVVQTLHNYRLMCPGATLYRHDGLCEDCLHRSTPWPGVLHACYRDSRAASAAVAAMLAVHRLLGTWTTRVDMYIAPTEFARRKFVENGLPADRIVVKPNFVPYDPGVGRHAGGYALFVGRLDAEKGIKLLLAAWQSIAACPLKVVGTGPLEPLVRSAAGIECLGQQPRARVFELMKDAAFLVFPSEYYETFGLTIVEAFATGLPVIASDRGAMRELVAHGRNGLRFTAGCGDALASVVEWAVAHPAEMQTIGRSAREEYEAKYTAAHNYSTLMEIYRDAVAD